MKVSDIPALKPTPTVTPRNGLVIVKILNLVEVSDYDSNNDDNNNKKDQKREFKRKDLNVEIIVEDYHEVSVVRNEEKENENNENEHENVDRKKKKKKLFLDCKVVNSNNKEESDTIMRSSETGAEVEMEALYESYFLLSENDPNILRFNIMSLSTCSSTTTTIGSSSASYLIKIPSREYKSSYSDWFHIKTATLNNNNDNKVSGVKVLLDISYIPPLSSTTTKRSNNENAMLTLTSSSSTLMDILIVLRKCLFVFFISIFIFESIQKKSFEEEGEIKPQDAVSIISSSSSLSSVSDITPPPTTTATTLSQVVQQINDHDIQATNDINTDKFVTELEVIMDHEDDDTTDIKNADIALLQYKDTLNDLLLKTISNNDINNNNKKQDLIKMKDSFQQTISLLELELELNRNSNDTDDESEILISLFSVKLNYFSTILHLYAMENLVEEKKEGGLLEGGSVVVVVKEDDGRRTTIMDELQTSFHNLLSDYDCSSLYNNSISLNDSSEATTSAKTTTTSSSFMKEKKRLCEITQNNLDFAIELNDVSSSSSSHEKEEKEKEESSILIEHHDDQEKELISTDITAEEGEIMENKPSTTVYEQYNQILQKVSSNDEQVMHEMKKTLEQIIITNNTEVDLFSLHLNHASVLLHLEALKYYDDTTNDSSKSVLQNVIDSFQQLLIKENCYYSDNDDTPPPPTTTRLCEITRNNLDFAYELSTQHQHSRHHQSSTAADMDNLLLSVSKYNEFVQDLLQMTFSDEEESTSTIQTKASMLKSIIDSFSLSSSSSLLNKEKEEVSSFQFSVKLNYASILLHLQTLKVNATVSSATSNDNHELELKSIINSFHQLFSDHCVVGVSSEESKRLCGITNNNLDFAQELLTAGAAKR
eukprot:CAMPEP_0178972212 /NCGR_PEP_ID=MMETSP0789-20121207/20855_1 /TAXON_ID=3005 /ORGANISM="Rhizosolenia setigera, Strain CCMP 1694" /LENGTH=880 /DNA_ID=CAMNT_0020659569 /DNA_START=63 /DNA_END=2705 /DNA_ORIENTATION=+